MPRTGRVSRTATLATAVVAAAALLLTGCATFPDAGPREWKPKAEGRGELGDPPAVPDPTEPDPESPGQPPPSGSAPTPSGPCIDQDPQVVATCLDPVGAIAVLPDAESALVAERTTGRVLKVRKGTAPQLVTTVPVDTAGGGGLTGLVLSPGYAEDQLLYAYVTSPTDNRVVRLAPDEPAKPVLVGIPRGPVRNGGALGVDGDGALLVATGDAGGNAADPVSLAGKVLRIDTFGKPAKGNPVASSPVLSSGLTSPGGLCVDGGSGTTWVSDRGVEKDRLHRVRPGPLPEPAWTWPDRPGVAGCAVEAGQLWVAQSTGAKLYMLRPGPQGGFTGKPETFLANAYGRLGPAAIAPDGLLWLGTVNKAGGAPVGSDDRVIRFLPPAGGPGKA